ncbi:MAG: hypothetical protein ABI947_30180 [Chloroflexota bacterium]
MKLTSYLVKKLSLRLPLLTSLLLIAALTGHSVVAQEAEKQINYDSPVKGHVDDSNVEDVWDFAAAGSDLVNITVERIDGTLVPHVELRTNDGKVLATAEKDGTFARATISSVLLPAPGSYEIVVSRYQGKDGKTSGSYQMRALPVGTGVDFAGTTMIQGTLKIGADRKGTLANIRWQDSWAINLDSTTPVTITVTRVSGLLVPTLALLDASRKELVKADPDDTFATAAITNYTAAIPGQYVIVISRADGMAGLTTGDYQLTIATGTK